MSFLVDVLRLTRIEHSIMLVIAVIAAELIAGNGVLPNTYTLILSFVTPIFVSMSAFAINDYFDIEVDTLNKKIRPLTEGKMSPNHALAIAVISMIIGVAASYLINWYCFAIALIFGALALLYSYKLKETLFIGNAYVAFSMSIPFVFGNYVVSSNMGSALILVSVMIFIAGLGREIQGTIRDYKGDSARGVKSLPRCIGIYWSSMAALIAYIIAIAISAYLFFDVSPFLGNLIFGALILITDILLLYAGFGYLSSRKQQFYDKARNISLAAMAIALVAILITAASL